MKDSKFDSIPAHQHSLGVNTKGLSEELQSALTDLLVLGMYQDGHIAVAEDDRVKRLIDTFNLGSDYARQQFTDAAIARVSRTARTTEAIRSAVFEAAAHFQDAKHRRQALDILAELLASDNQVTNEENQFLLMVEEALELKKPR